MELPIFEAFLNEEKKVGLAIVDNPAIEENFICFSAVYDMAGRFFSVCVWNHRTSAHAYCRYATG